MDKRCYSYSNLLFRIFFLIIAVYTNFTKSEDTCDTLKRTISYPNIYRYILWITPFVDTTLIWHNMTTWDGHVQIPEKENLAPECLVALENSLVLTEKHPDIEDINENTIEVSACGLNEELNCIWNTSVQMKKCNGNLLYSFPWLNYTYEHYICFDRIFADLPCKEAVSVQTYDIRHDSVLKFTADDRYGWADTFIGKQQFVYPSVVDIERIINACSLRWPFFLQEPIPDEIGDDPVRLVACSVYKYIHGGSYHFYSDDNGNCHTFIYVRSCSGKLQLDLTFDDYHEYDICLIPYYNVKVQPEISHEETTITENGKEVVIYTSSLYYICSFEAVKSTQYKTNWYINGTFHLQMGPSSNMDDMVFKEKYLTGLKHGYEVRCGVFPADENETVEVMSDAYFAGWKISNKDIILSKSGVANITIAQTIPVGCNYRADNVSNCVETILFEDLIDDADNCRCRIEAKSYDDPRKPLLEIKSLKKGEIWTKKSYTLQLSSVDNDYDDRSTFDLQLILTYNSFGNTGIPVTSTVVGEIHVAITDINRHRNKRCYSHVDPHMKTVDGIHYEAQREGDYMLFLNKKFQTEVQTSARYCSPGYTRGPVCACGIAIAVGADLFVMNRCHDQSFKFDLSCGDGGIIDIEHIHDYRYLVRTPIGTIIEIFLWGNVMNIDVYMSAKDFGNVAGLCGNFDGDRSNDLEHRDGTISDDYNRSYKFADSWRLTDEENLFININRKLDQWNENNARQTCTRPNSITRNKCKKRQRQRRSISGASKMKMSTHYQHLFSRRKRNTINFTEDEAFLLCNHSIFTTPAVQEFPDHLAEEDPDVVIEQCVYDVMQGNDTSWIDAHVTSLNNAADTILKMSPVYIANNTEKVKSFRTEMCLNNCSGNGICAETGRCECNEIFRGPDCSIDIRIPPVVFEIEGHGVCTIKDEDDCACFQIRTDNIFDGFMCNITKYKVYSNGSRIESATFSNLGNYEDIFNGECCVPTATKNSFFDFISDTDNMCAIMYEFSISNDGANYGDVNPVYIYDTDCIEHVEMDDAVTFGLKDNYCFIASTCVSQNFEIFVNDTCFICDLSNDPYGWTKYDCDDSGTVLGTGAIVGIVTGSTIIVVVACIVIYVFVSKVIKKHSSSIGVQPKALVSDNNLRIQQPQQSDSLTKCNNPAKPKFQQNVLIGASHQQNQGVKDFSAKESDVIHKDFDNNQSESGQHSATPQPKRDISFIDIELE